MAGHMPDDAAFSHTRDQYPEPGATHPPEWWRGAAIYQIYPRSFFDTNGDGIGDLAGITQRLHHVASLGVDAIWISPFFTSPMKDFGYDVADYCDVDPIFGSLSDFDALVERAHALGLKVTIDQVFAHTSNLHPWFMESRADHTSHRADWYVWRDARPDGTPPNNWQSVFGGPAWTWDARRRQYYMHQFLKEQPQLNVHSEEVQVALLDTMRFWLDRGVDGFRLDALNHSMFDPAFRDNPPAPANTHARTRPFDFQEKRYSQSHPGVVPFIERIRRLCDEYGAIFTVAEVGGDKAEVEMKSYTAGDRRLNSAYGFNFLYAPALTPQLVADTLALWPGEPAQEGPDAGLAEGWPSWAFENHDAPRAVSRWCAPEQMEAFARVKAALLIALRGNIILYQGEELALEQDEIPFHQLRDPEAIANWPLTLSRDGVRTPLPWNIGSQGGFTTGEPWLPLSEKNIARAVSEQESDPVSQLNLTRRLLDLRRAHPALRLGTLEDCKVAGDLLAFTRGHDTETIRCHFNLGPEGIAIEAGEGEAILSINGAAPDLLPAFGALLVKGI